MEVPPGLAIDHGPVPLELVVPGEAARTETRIDRDDGGLGYSWDEPPHSHLKEKLVDVRQRCCPATSVVGDTLDWVYRFRLM